MKRYVFAYINDESVIDLRESLVKLRILPKPISEYSEEDIGSIIYLPYDNKTNRFENLPTIEYKGTTTTALEFKIVAVNHHKDYLNESRPTLTLVLNTPVLNIGFDAEESGTTGGILENPVGNRRAAGNNRWSVSNIRNWMNSNTLWVSYGSHQYDIPPFGTNFDSIRPEADRNLWDYSNEPGFLYGFDEDIFSHIALVRNVTMLDPVDMLIKPEEFASGYFYSTLSSYISTSIFYEDNHPDNQFIGFRGNGFDKNLTQIIRSENIGEILPEHNSEGIFNITGTIYDVTYDRAFLPSITELQNNSYYDQYHKGMVINENEELIKFSEGEGSFISGYEYDTSDSSGYNYNILVRSVMKTLVSGSFDGYDDGIYLANAWAPHIPVDQLKSLTIVIS